MQFFFIHPQATIEHWGYIPSFLSESDPRSAKEQFNANYVSGWTPFNGHRMDDHHGLHYPGDPVMYPLSILRFREERIFLYPHAWVVVIQPDGSWESARLD
jgi:hypothetical protein